MRELSGSWLAWSRAALSGIMFVAAVALHVLARSMDSPGEWSTLGTVGQVLSFLPFLAFPLVGALIASRRLRNSVGWILLADGLLWTFGSVLDSYRVYGLARPGSVPFPVATYALSQWLWVPAVGLFAIYLILLFPDGRLPDQLRASSMASVVWSLRFGKTQPEADMMGRGSVSMRKPALMIGTCLLTGHLGLLQRFVKGRHHR